MLPRAFFDPVNLQPHPGYVGLKSGESEAIPWRKVQLTKQCNVGLTTDGLWAMPLNTGWVPVKERRLQDWEKLKKYVPVHKQGDVCPNGVPALPEKGNAHDGNDSNVMKLCIHVCVRSPMCSSVLKNVSTYPPLTHTFLKRPFLTDFKNYTPPPPPTWLHVCTSVQNL